MKQLIDHVQYAIKGALKDDNAQYVLIEHEGKQYTRKIKYKPFSNFPIEYINWNNTQYQVNTVKEVYWNELQWNYASVRKWLKSMLE